MQRYIGEEGRNIHSKEISPIDEMQHSIFFIWKVDVSHENNSLQRASHCEIYEAVQASKFWEVWINFNRYIYLQIFPKDDLIAQEEGKNGFFLN
jgi:hypothetical protein